MYVCEDVIILASGKWTDARIYDSVNENKNLFNHSLDRTENTNMIQKKKIKYEFVIRKKMF